MQLTLKDTGQGASAMKIKEITRLKKTIIFSTIIIIAALLIGSYLMKRAYVKYESIMAKTGDITTYFSFSGNVESKNRQILISEKQMQVSVIHVKEGDMVKQGDVLLTTSLGEELKAKIDGEVVKIYVEEGGLYTSGRSLMDIVDFDNLQISVKVDEYELEAVTKGKETIVDIGALDKKIKGVISSVSKVGQTINGVTFFTAEIELESDPTVLIGMSAEVRIKNQSVENAVTLPVTVIQFDDYNKPYVLKSGRAANSTVKQEIEIGINDGTMVEIKSGVQSGEVVLFKNETKSFVGFEQESLK